MTFYKTHEIEFHNDNGLKTVFELRQELPFAPSSVEKLRVLNTGETIIDETDSDGCGVMNSRYLLTLKSGPNDDLFEVFDNADPQSVYLRIIVDNKVEFVGFLEPKTLEREYGTEGRDTIISGEFFSGIGSIGQVPIYPDFLETIMTVANVQPDTMISYDLFFSGLFEKVCKYGSRLIYAWNYEAENWRKDAVSTVDWNMFLDMRFRFNIYKEDEERPGRTLGEILTDICRTWGLRIGYSPNREAGCIFDMLAGYNGSNIPANLVDNTGWTGGYPRLPESSSTTVELQTITDSDIRKGPPPIASKKNRVGMVTHDVIEFISDPQLDINATAEVPNPETDRPYLLPGYGYGTIPIRYTAGVIANTNVTVLTGEHPALTHEQIGYMANKNIPEIETIELPIHALLAYIWGGWRFYERRKWSGLVAKKIDPMIPILFDDTVWITTTREYDPYTGYTQLELLQIAWQDPFN